MSDQEEDSRRTRQLTAKGQEMYISTKDDYVSRLQKARETLETCLNTETTDDSEKSITEKKTKISYHFETYTSIFDDYKLYLNRQNTDESVEELKRVRHLREQTYSSVKQALSRLDRKQNGLLEHQRRDQSDIRSQASSRRTHASTSSRMSDTIARMKAKAQAARVNMEYAEKEIQLQRKRAELDAELNVLSQRKIVAAAEAECEVLERETKLYDSNLTPENLASREYHDTTDRTAKFLKDMQDKTTSKVPTQGFTETRLDPNCQPFAPNYNSNAYKQDMLGNGSIAADLTRFLLKKDLLLSRLTNFNDQPETFLSWKSSFRNIVKDLEVNPSEEIDLMVKYLGPESSRYALNIRSAYFENAHVGLSRLWERLDERYGRPELIDASLRHKIDNFPKLTSRDNKKLFELSDILCEIEAIKENPRFQQSFAFYDSSSGLLPIIRKLPHAIQEKWTNHAVRYKEEHDVSFPPFSSFVSFIRRISRIKNDPSFQYNESSASNDYASSDTKSHRRFINDVSSKTRIHTNKTELKPSTDRKDTDFTCSFHRSTKHTINECKGFKAKPIEERRQFLKENGICFLFCESSRHRRKDCSKVISCTECGSSTHPSALHVDSGLPKKDYGGELSTTRDDRISNKCTQVCGKHYNGKSCSKTILVKVYKKEDPSKAFRAYAILDEQSNRSLGSTDLFNSFDIRDQPSAYHLTSCAGTVMASGRRASNIVVESLDGRTAIQIPSLVECELPNIREEIPTSDVARYHSHLSHIATEIPDLDDEAQIALLIGRDIPEAHHIYQQITGPKGTPYAQKIGFGWVVIGETCLKNFHPPNSVVVNKTFILQNGRSSICKPCPNKFEITETKFDETFTKDKGSLFERNKYDDEIGPSIEDNLFLETMHESVHKGDDGFWIASLPFRQPQMKMPNNREYVLRRTKSLISSLKKNQQKKTHFLEFMDKVFRNKHAEVAPPIEKANGDQWYLPIFGVYHPKKPNKVRVVFDSSAKFEKISLNDVLMSGPDLINSLLGVLLRFRKDLVGAIADIEQMFYCFVVSEKHRDFLRFFWFKDNNPTSELIEYRMRVHVFGNSPSPSIANYCLLKTVESAKDRYGEDVVEFVSRSFYVDDGLLSSPSPEHAIDLMTRTREALKNEGNLRLHKIASNSQAVMDAFPMDDIAGDLQNIDLGSSDSPMQRSLGLFWNLQIDSFTYKVTEEEKPFTRRGILSVVNSLYDPLGFIAPIVVQGKLILRKVMQSTSDWDEPLPNSMRPEWDTWRQSLHTLDNLSIPRSYVKIGWNNIVDRKIFVYTDASEKAVAAVAFLKSIDTVGQIHVGFIMGKAKVAPLNGHSIPRLELCAALMGIQIAEVISSELDIDMDSFRFYTDSKVTLGYISNNTKRFYMYVANRVARIRKSSKPNQWFYVQTHLNPADVGTRPVVPNKLQQSMWLQASEHIINQDEEKKENQTYNLVNPSSDTEVRLNVLKSDVNEKKPFLLTRTCEKFSSWKNLVNAIKILKTRVGPAQNTVADVYNRTINFIIKETQSEMIGDEMKCARKKLPLPKGSRIGDLNPFIDSDGLLRVGGRLDNADIDYSQKHPIIIPGNHRLAILLIRHYHAECKHQGRHFTSGAVRSAGYWIVGQARLVSSVIHACVTCRKLRGKYQQQLMSDLPADRVTPSAPFSAVGIDTFGPWQVVTRKTRGGQSNNKRWALIFTCLSTRAIHIEVIEELSTSSFINALRRMISLRGSIHEIRSDRGTNFVGSTDHLNINTINVEDGSVKKFLDEKRTTWKFNPPHSSHMGGVWERMIGITRRILNSMIHEVQTRTLTHEVLTTFLAEVCAIVNGRPIVPISSDPETPEALTPSMILTQKSGFQPITIGNFDTKDLYKAQWKRVQHLADCFWKRWKREYLNTLQTRRKWKDTRQNLKEGDIVLVKDDSIPRNEWSLGVIVTPLPSADNEVRKATVRLGRNGSTYLRPISELVLLLNE